MTNFYREVPAERVDEGIRRAAQGALSFASADLGLADLRIRWFTEGASLDLADCLAGLAFFDRPTAIDGLTRVASPRDLWLRTGMTLQKTAEVAMHEALHAFQFQTMGGPTGTLEGEGWERQARTYQRDLAGIARSIGGST